MYIVQKLYTANSYPYTICMEFYFLTEEVTHNLQTK